MSAYIASALTWVPCLKKIRSTAIGSTLPCQQERFNAHNSCTILNHNFKITLQLVTFEEHVWQMLGNALCLSTVFCCLFLVLFIGWKLLIATPCYPRIMVALVSANFINNFNLLWWHRFSQCFAWIWQNYITVFLFVLLEQSTTLVNAYNKHFNCEVCKD